MRNKHIFIILIGIIILPIFIKFVGFDLIFDSNSNQNKNHNFLLEKKITLGYCPTMFEFANKIKEQNDFVELIDFSSTAQALNYLNSNKVDIILVGRIAKKEELENVHFLKLRSGLTLIGNTKRFVLSSDLDNKIIHTAINDNIVDEYFSNTDNFVFYENKIQALENGFDDIVLIDWNDYEDNFELVIPIDNNMNKIEKFRIPVLYTFNKNFLENLNINI